MEAKHETLERIEEFVQAISEPSSEGLSAPLEPWGFRKMIATPNSAVANKQHEAGSLFLGGRLGELYLKALDSLETDPAFENLARADSGMARSRAKARVTFSSHGQRLGRCRVNRRAERVSRPTRAKTRRRRVLVVTIC